MPNEDDNVLSIDMDSLTIDEIEEIEEIVGGAIDSAFAAGQPKGKALRALGYITRRRTDPDFTLDQAGQLVVKLEQPEPRPT